MATPQYTRLEKNRAILVCCLFVAGLSAIGWTLFHQTSSSELLAADGAPAKSEPQELFVGWPTNQKPELVLLVTGQTYGYLQKCGCSNPQKGGLERRYNFVQSLKAKGWEVVGLDLGDVMRPLKYTPTDKQTLTKYEVAMQAMKLMGYKSVAVGKEELSAQLINPLQKFSLQKGNETPKIHFANIENPDDFPNATGGSALTESEIISATKSDLKIGVVGVVGAEIQNQGIDNSVKYSPRTGPVLSKVLKNWAAANKAPDLNILLYAGPLDWKDPVTNVKNDAETIVQQHPQFHIVVCQTSDSEPPNNPKPANGGKTIIVQVGQRGQNVGVIGVYRNNAGVIQLYYQRVTMSDEFETPADKEADQPVLKLLQEYSNTVKDNDFLSEMVNRKKLHPVQAQFKNAAFVGDGQCFICHKDEHGAWMKSKHAAAHSALEKIAVRPTGRQFDGECIICHTVGYDYKTGFVNQKKTPELMNVQCESCHGPGNLHVAEEQANLKAAKPTSVHIPMLSPWKAGNPKAKLPSIEKFEAMSKERNPEKRDALMTIDEKQAYQGVYQTCAKCHDMDNDPKFELYDYWKNIVHSNLAPKKPAKAGANKK